VDEVPEEQEPIGEQLQKALRRLTIATVIVYVALVSIFVVGYVVAAHQRQALAETAVNTNNTLCALRADLEARVDAAKQFLDDNPKGVLGFPVEVIEQNIKNQEQTVEALSTLDCS
jgi:predicted PurR-regulated permease PerM